MGQGREFSWIAGFSAGSLVGHGWATWIALSWLLRAGLPVPQLISQFVLPGAPFFVVVAALGIGALRGSRFLVPWGGLAFPFLLGEGIPALTSLAQPHVSGQIVWANGLGGLSDLALVAWLSRLLAVWWLERGHSRPR